jgi:hypothetical protein
MNFPPDASQHFSRSYAQSRQRFVAAAQGAGASLHSFAHPLLGIEGEALAMDLAMLGEAHSPRALMLSSACHGIEGYCGSGVQMALLADGELLAQAKAQGVALVLVHALNPHGFSFGRRVTEDHVDLNRNTQDFAAPLPASPGYDELASALVPDAWPPTADNEARLAAYAQRHGQSGLAAAITGGQYHHPGGLFYGGSAPTWSQQTLRRLLREHGSHWQRLGWIDVHTGLGPSGHGERIFAHRNDAAALARTRAWWGEAVTSMFDGSSSSAKLDGLLVFAALQELPQCELTSIALEFGTEPIDVVIGALRASAWANAHPHAPQVQQDAIRAEVRRAFYTETARWKAQIVQQGLQAVREGVQALATARH